MSAVSQLHTDVIYSLATVGKYVYAACSTGLHRTQDRGKSWKNLTESIDLQDTITTTAVTGVGKTIFAGANGTILRSEDEGKSWTLIGLASPSPIVTAIVKSPNYATDGTVVAATAEDGVFVSRDYGQRWTPWNFGLIDLDVNCAAISPDFGCDQTILVGTETGVFLSRNSGQSWQECDLSMDVAPVVSVGISHSYILAGMEKHGLFASEDGGQTWSQVDIPIAPDESIHQILLQDDGTVLLTDYQLLLLQTDTLACSPLHKFHDQQALTLTQLNEKLVVGFADGNVQII